MQVSVVKDRVAEDRLNVYFRKTPDGPEFRGDLAEKLS